MIRKLKRAIGSRFNFLLNKTINGKNFRIPIAGGLGGAMRAEYEPWMLKTLRESLNVTEAQHASLLAELRDGVNK